MCVLRTSEPGVFWEHLIVSAASRWGRHSAFDRPMLIDVESVL